jgi:hypothetical protein
MHSTCACTHARRVKWMSWAQCVEKRCLFDRLTSTRSHTCRVVMVHDVARTHSPHTTHARTHTPPWTRHHHATNTGAHAWPPAPPHSLRATVGYSWNRGTAAAIKCDAVGELRTRCSAGCCVLRHDVRCHRRTQLVLHGCVHPRNLRLGLHLQKVRVLNSSLFLPTNTEAGNQCTHCYLHL